MKKTGCEFCVAATEAGAGILLFFVGVLFVVFVLIPQLKRNRQLRELFAVIGRVAPALVGDIQIMIGVYQVFTAMGVTLNMKFPPMVEQWMQMIRGWVSFDIFSLPGVGCLANTTIFQKIYIGFFAPLGIAMLIALNWLWNNHKLSHELEERLRKLGHHDDPKDHMAGAGLCRKRAVSKKDQVAKAHLKEIHKQTRQEGRLASRGPGGEAKEQQHGVAAKKPKAIDVARSKRAEATLQAKADAQTKQQKQAQTDAALEKGVNKMEALTGKDLDGDGDVGLAGSPDAPAEGTDTSPTSVAALAINKLEATTGVDIDRDGDVGVLGVAQDAADPATAGDEEEEEEEEEMDPAELEARFDSHQAKAELRQTAITTGLFVIFLAFPAVTNKIFSFFMCYQTGAPDSASTTTQFMYADFSQQCKTTHKYGDHIMWVFGMMMAWPIGIPTLLLLLLWRHRKAILVHEGPHELESLYIDYKPECYLWEVYQMLQKVTLIGLLTFIERGSILQALIGLLVCSMLLMMMLNSKPYELSRTNTLAVFGQALIVVAYLSAVVLRVDLTGELFTVGMVGWAMIAANLPMAGYLIWDSYLTIRDELHHARIDLIRVELGRIGSHYRCVEERGVAVSRKMLKPKADSGIDFNSLEIGRIQFNEIVVVNAQAVVFQDGGAVGRLHNQGGEGQPVGWFSYNHHGLTGARHFELADTNPKEGSLVGHVHVEIRRAKTKVLVNVLRINWSEKFLIETIGEKADKEERGQKLYVEVRINRTKKHTDFVTFMDGSEDSKGPSWNEGVGQGMSFDVTDPDDPEGDGVVEVVMIKVWGCNPTWLEESDDAMKLDKNGEPEPVLLALKMMDLEDKIAESEWDWDCSGVNAPELKAEAGCWGFDESPETEDAEESAASLHEGLWKNPMLGDAGESSDDEEESATAPPAEQGGTAPKSAGADKATGQAGNSKPKKGDGEPSVVANPMFAAKGDAD